MSKRQSDILRIAKGTSSLFTPLKWEAFKLRSGIPCVRVHYDDEMLDGNYRQFPNKRIALGFLKLLKRQYKEREAYVSHHWNEARKGKQT